MKINSMSDNTFWVLINMTIGLAIVSFAFVVSDYWKDHNKKIVDLIKSGNAEPIEAMCAMQDDYGKNPVCLVLASKDKD